MAEVLCFWVKQGLSLQLHIPLSSPLLPFGLPQSALLSSVGSDVLHRYPQELQRRFWARIRCQEYFVALEIVLLPLLPILKSWHCLSSSTYLLPEPICCQNSDAVGWTTNWDEVIDREEELFIPPPVANPKSVIATRRTPEIPWTVMRTPSFVGIFNKRLTFYRKCFPRLGKKIALEVRSLKVGTTFKEPDRAFMFLSWGGISLLQGMFHS